CPLPGCDVPQRQDEPALIGIAAHLEPQTRRIGKGLKSHRLPLFRSPEQGEAKAALHPLREDPPEIVADFIRPPETEKPMGRCVRVDQPPLVVDGQEWLGDRVEDVAGERGPCTARVGVRISYRGATALRSTEEEPTQKNENRRQPRADRTGEDVGGK